MKNNIKKFNIITIIIGLLIMFFMFSLNTYAENIIYEDDENLRIEGLENIPYSIGEQNEFVLRNNLVDGFCACHFEVEEHFFVAGAELQGTFEPKDAVGNVVGAIVSTAQVVADIGGEILLCELAVELDGRFVVGTGVSAVRLSFQF